MSFEAIKLQSIYHQQTNPVIVTIVRRTKNTFLFIFFRKWQDSLTLNMKDTIKFTTFAVSQHLPVSHVLHSFSCWLQKLCHCCLMFSGEKGYDPQFFHYKVERVFIDDHNVPFLGWVTYSDASFKWHLTQSCNLADFRLQLHKKVFCIWALRTKWYICIMSSYNVFIIVCCTFCLRDMLKYTASVREWMSADPKNIIAIHCKGGKGDALVFIFN